MDYPILHSTGYESVPDEEIMQMSFANFPTWRIAQKYIEDIEAKPGMLFRTVEDPATGKTVMEKAETLDVVFVSTIISRLKKDANQDTQCYSDDGEFPISKYVNKFASSCAECPYKNMATADLAKGDTRCKKMYKLLFYPLSNPTSLECLILTSGNWHEYLSLLKKVRTSRMVEGVDELHALYGYKMRIKTIEGNSDQYDYFVADFDCLGLNDTDKMIEIDQLLSARGNLFLDSGSAPKQIAAPEQTLADELKQKADEAEEVVENVVVDDKQSVDDEIPF